MNQRYSDFDDMPNDPANPANKGFENEPEVDQSVNGTFDWLDGKQVEELHHVVHDVATAWYHENKAKQEIIIPDEIRMMAHCNAVAMDDEVPGSGATVRLSRNAFVLALRVAFQLGYLAKGDESDGLLIFPDPQS
jgi:hypothetical protein